jgi:transcriptional regulator GlxA family with amidase domain
LINAAKFVVFWTASHLGDERMARTIGILIFDCAEEMDFVGPWEVLTAATDGQSGEDVVLIAEHGEPVVCEKGMRVIPNHTYRDAPALDVLLIPGGSGARREIENPATVTWLRSVNENCSWIASVCTGAFLLVGSGLAKGHKVTTHHDFISALRDMNEAEILEGVRFVRDGRVLTAGGVMSGIEMSLWLVNELYGPETMERTKRYIAYDYPPRAVATIA